ncbi:MAG: hypothetical protein PHT99_04155 [Methanoregula sp.]|nr:hypothetical protein [Methanoregula sp.]
MHVTKSISVTEPAIPLYLLPQAIAHLIRKKGDAVYRISVKRTRWHHYNVSVRTKRIKRELAPVTVAVLQALPGAGAEKKHHAAKKGRRCAA